MANERSRLSIEGQLRDGHARLDAFYVEGSIWPLQRRARELRCALDAMPAEEAELYRYFPVAAIALAESYFKSAIAFIVDHGNEYLERGLTLMADRSLRATEAIAILKTGVATAGQLIAHLLPFRSLSNIETTFDALLGKSVKQLLKTVNDPYQERTGHQEPIKAVLDVAALWKALDKAFRQRHILAHEAAPDYEVSARDARDAVDAADYLMRGIDAVLWSTIWRDEPLTQRERNNSAEGKMRRLRRELASLLRVLRARGKLDLVRHRIWRTYFLGYLRHTATDAMPAIAPYLFAETASDLLRNRIAMLALLLRDEIE